MVAVLAKGSKGGGVSVAMDGERRIKERIEEEDAFIVDVVACEIGDSEKKRLVEVEWCVDVWLWGKVTMRRR